MNNKRNIWGGVHLPITAERRQGTLIDLSPLIFVKGGQRRREEVILRG